MMKPKPAVTQMTFAVTVVWASIVMAAAKPIAAIPHAAHVAADNVLSDLLGGTLVSR